MTPPLAFVAHVFGTHKCQPRWPAGAAVVAEHFPLIARRTPAATIRQTGAHPDQIQSSSPETADKVSSQMPSRAALQRNVSARIVKTSFLPRCPGGVMR